jgi:hypothetical protein
LEVSPLYACTLAVKGAVDNREDELAELQDRRHVVSVQGRMRKRGKEYVHPTQSESVS